MDRDVALGRDGGVLTFLWSQIAGPVLLDFEPTAPVLSLVIPPGVEGVFTVRLVVDDGQDATVQEVQFAASPAVAGGGTSLLLIGLSGLRNRAPLTAEDLMAGPIGAISPFIGRLDPATRRSWELHFAGGSDDFPIREGEAYLILSPGEDRLVVEVTPAKTGF